MSKKRKYCFLTLIFPLLALLSRSAMLSPAAPVRTCPRPASAFAPSPSTWTSSSTGQNVSQSLINSCYALRVSQLYRYILKCIGNAKIQE